MPEKSRRARHDSGQALVEFAFAAPILLVIVFGMIDIGRVLFVGQVIVNLTGEGCALASRGTSLSDTATAIATGSSTLDFAGHGRVVVSSIYNSNNVLKLTGQATQGGLSVSSRIGSTIGDTVSLPAAAAPQPNQTVFVTEVFYTYHSITPLGSFMPGAVMPSQLYDVGYY